ncbi:MAG: hypothetical protein Q4D66_01200 [Bacteroidales bacterium]|nr:hypothetical protein [Bacteroidales bacterium]
MKKQQYITPQMECVSYSSEGLLAGSIGVDEQLTIKSQAEILNQGKSENPSIWE